MNKYMLGNFLRCGFTGDFNSIDEAWAALGSRFLLSFPCDEYDKTIGYIVENDASGRYVQMYVYEKNKHGLDDKVLCKSDSFNMKDRIKIIAGDYHQVPATCFF